MSIPSAYLWTFWEHHHQSITDVISSGSYVGQLMHSQQMQEGCSLNQYHKHTCKHFDSNISNYQSIYDIRSIKWIISFTCCRQDSGGCQSCWWSDLEENGQWWAIVCICGEALLWKNRTSHILVISWVHNWTGLFGFFEFCSWMFLRWKWSKRPIL